MIKLDGAPEISANGKSAKVALIADTKSEVTSMQLSDIVGLPQGIESLELGSTVMTTSMDIGIMQSTGAWNWG